MSAFVVHPEHINVLIWAGLRPAINSNAELTWHYGNPTFQGRLDHSTRNDIGRMLLAENVASINDSAPWGGGLRIGVESRAVINESC